MLETLKLYKNKVRIWLKKRFTDQVKEIVIKDDETGEEHKVTTEKQVEKVCDHSTITRIAPTFFKCANKDCDQYFLIYHWVNAKRPEIIEQVSTMAEHLDLKLVNKDDDGGE